MKMPLSSRSLFIFSIIMLIYHGIPLQAAAHSIVGVAGASSSPSSSAVSAVSAKKPSSISSHASSSFATGFSPFSLNAFRRLFKRSTPAAVKAPPAAAPALAAAASIPATKTLWSNPFAGKSSSSSKGVAIAKPGKNGLFTTAHNVGAETRELIGGIADKGLTVGLAGAAHFQAGMERLRETASLVSMATVEASRALPDSAAKIGEKLDAKELKKAAGTLLKVTATAGKYLEDTADMSGQRLIQAVDVGGDHVVRAVTALDSSVARIENIAHSTPMILYKIVKSGSLAIGGVGIGKKGIDLITEGVIKYYNINSDPEKQKRISKEGALRIITGISLTFTGALGMYLGQRTARSIALRAPTVVPPAMPVVIPAG